MMARSRWDVLDAVMSRTWLLYMLSFVFVSANAVALTLLSFLTFGESMLVVVLSFYGFAWAINHWFYRLYAGYEIYRITGRSGLWTATRALIRGWWYETISDFSIDEAVLDKTPGLIHKGALQDPRRPYRALDTWISVVFATFLASPENGKEVFDRFNEMAGERLEYGNRWHGQFDDANDVKTDP